MIVLKALTYHQKKKIEDLTSGSYLIRFVKDNNGSWIVSKNILNDLNFKNLKSEFEHLEEIEYNPIVENGF